MTIQSNILLQDLLLNLNLGWPSKERQTKQKVLLDINIQFAHPPQACVSDLLTDTFCYDQLIKMIKQKISEKPFRLLEHLGHEIYQLLKSEIQSPHKISIKITKKPKIANLKKGVSFYYGDEMAPW